MATKYYEELGLSNDANEDEIKKKYRKLAKIYHPDRNNHLPKEEKEEKEEKFRKITLAYNKLISSEDNSEDSDMDISPVIIASMQNMNDRIFVESILPMLFESKKLFQQDLFFNLFDNMSTHISDIYQPHPQNFKHSELKYDSDKFKIHINDGSMTIKVAYNYASFIRHKIKKINIKIHDEILKINVRLNRNNLSGNMIKKMKNEPIDQIVLPSYKHNIENYDNIIVLIYCKSL